jgi:alkanesulfonate monooxygenase SsuD/methylene tetrahydromethanopterin reductase-like flavin-dependent oxidoreductase (luciferase family)
MRTVTTIEASGFQNWSDGRDFVVESERLGLDICWVAEAWGSDAPSAIGYSAACTDRILLGSGVIQVATLARAIELVREINGARTGR